MRVSDVVARGCAKAVASSSWRDHSDASAASRVDSVSAKSTPSSAGRPPARRSPGTHPFHYVRRYLADQQAYCCAGCGRADEWQGQPLTLVLDHDDGDSSHNHLDNVRLVCPHCDSPLPTHQSHHRGRGRHLRRHRYAAGSSC